jgi:hypothetical protein
MQRSALTALAAATLLLAACGGGGDDGGGGGGNGGGTTPPPADTVGITVDGTAAKGPIANGRVTAHAVNSDGSMDAAALASTTTNSSGAFSLSFRSRAGQPVVVMLDGQPAAGTSSHEDEVSGHQDLPARFQLRGAVVPADGANVRMTLTPFSEMAVAAAQKGGGGLTIANIASGNNAVRQLLGFDPTKVQVKADLAGATADELKLKVMLTAVSQMAAKGRAGCATGTGGEKVSCVVEQLAAAAQPTTLQLKTDDRPDLGAEIADAVQDALEEQFAGKVSSAVLATIVANLGCKGDDCKPAAPPPSTGNAVADAIAATKALIQQIRSDFTALFVSGSTANIGDAQSQASTFADRMSAVQVPAELMIRDTTALMVGIDLWNDFKAGRSGNTRNKWKGDYASSGTPPPNNQLGGIGCTVFSDSNNQVPATSPTSAVQVGCSARFFIDFTTGQTGTSSTSGPTEYAHGFTILPGSNASTFTYRTRAFRRLRSNPLGAQTFLPEGSTLPPGRAGTVTLTLDSAGDFTSFAAAGTLPPAFEMGGTALLDDHQDYTVSLTRSGTSTTTSTMTVTGSVASKDSGNATRGTLTVRSGSVTETPDSGGQLKVASATLDLTWATPGAEFQGALDIGDRVASKDGAQVIPARASVSGTFTNIDNGVRSDFASGTFALTVSGFANFNAGQASTSTNFFTTDASFTGSISAPNRPLLRLTLGTSMKSFEHGPSAVTLQYRSLVAGTPRMTIDLTATKDSAGVPTVTLAESSTGVSLSATRGAASADVLLDGTTKIGVVDLDTGVLTFTDGSFVSTELKP